MITARAPETVVSEQSDLVELINARFHKSPYRALHYLTCHDHEGMVIIQGNVPTFHTKQVALATAHDVPGVEKVVDCIDVNW